MRSTAVLALAASLAGCLFGGNLGPDMKRQERRELRAAVPAPLEASHPWDKDPRPVPVRIWVDEDFRAQNLRWRAEIEEQVDEANQFLVPALGVRLEVSTFEPWAARSAGRAMAELVTDLEAKDPGDGVGWVIAYVSSLSNVSISFEELGMAHLLGKHIVVRGYADAGERKAFAAAFPRTTEEERDRVHQARRRHKQTVVLIHELAHTLGAVHEVDESWIMHGGYSVAMSQLSDRGRELMQIALDERLKPAPEQDARSLAGRMVSFLDANPWGGWDPESLEQLKIHLRAVMDSSIAGGPGDSMKAPDIPVPPAAYDQFKRAQALAARGESAAALAELEALVAAYPGTAEIRQAICEVHIGASGPGSEAADKACTRAAEVSPDDPRPYLARVEAFLRVDDRAHALALVAGVEARAGERAPVWDRVAAIYQATGRVTQAEAAARRSQDLAGAASHPILEWAARHRARYGLPPDARRWKIAPADEGDYVVAVRQLLDLIYADKVSEAQAAIRAAEKRWKGAPGILAARCDLHLRRGDRGAARTLCAQAVAAWNGAAWAHYLEGVMALQDHKDARAVTSLRAAVAADPELGQAYRALGKALTRTKDDAGWTALAAEYQRRFGQQLPR